MPDKTTKKRTRHSYRQAIREVIEFRMARGMPLNHRLIIEDAGGGSSTTVAEEMANAKRPAPAALVGRGAKAPSQRIAALEDALNASLEREKALEAENAALKRSLDDSRSGLEKLILQHQDSQRLLLQGVDDLRQMVKAGQVGMPQGIIAAERQKAAGTQSTDALLWKARHDQLLGRYMDLESTNRKQAARLHDLGEEVD